MGENIKDIHFEALIRSLLNLIDSKAMEPLTLLMSLIIFAGIVSSQVAPTLDPRIVGGRNVQIESHPYQVSLRWNNMHYCGGSIIAQDKVLTAAHCTDGYNHSLVTVRVGAADIFEGTTYELREVVQHPKYNSYTTSHDVSVLLLKTPLEYGPKVQPVALATKRPAVGSYQFITGWGDTSQSSVVIYRNLQGTRVPVVSQTSCQRLYSKQEINGVMLCAGFLSGRRDSCQGDSGGPMVDTLTKKQSGIISWGVGCAQRRKPGVYASIPDLLDFILSV